MNSCMSLRGRTHPHSTAKEEEKEEKTGYQINCSDLMHEKCRKNKEGDTPSVLAGAAGGGPLGVIVDQQGVQHTKAGSISLIIQ